MTCPCDFCTGVKRWADNWCACCGNVRMEPPKSAENMDVCDPCDARLYIQYTDVEHDPGDEDRSEP